jgi:hypothetical protein
MGIYKYINMSAHSDQAHEQIIINIINTKHYEP